MAAHPQHDRAGILAKKGNSEPTSRHVVYGTFLNPEEGATAAGESTSYSKTYLYYSGSVINISDFRTQGYQDSFDWPAHLYSYAGDTTTYSVIKTYTRVGYNSHTIVGFGDPPTETTEYTYDYDWVSKEGFQDVHIDACPGLELYIQPSSMGIIAEWDGYVPPSCGDPVGYVGAEEHTHEEAYTDLSAPIFSASTDDDGNHTVDVRCSQTENMFITSMFGSDSSTLSTSEAMNAHLESLALQIFNTSLVAKNTFPTIPAPPIRQINLREIPTIESAFSASVNTNLSDGTTAVLIDDSFGYDLSELTSS